MKTNKHSHLTAIERTKLSKPMKWLKDHYKLAGEILDYGCGLGTDVGFLKEKQYDIEGYDKYYFTKISKSSYDTITCIYVLNVLKPLEQTKVIMEISHRLKPGGKAYFVVRRDIKHEGFRVHKKHKKHTYQTYVKLPFKSIYSSNSFEIYEYQHYNITSLNKQCPFCKPKAQVIFETIHAYAIFDKYPVSEGHTLIIPKRHVENYFELSFTEIISCHLLINRVNIYLNKEYKPDSYNVGINIGHHAGQTIDHVHIHLIPRYKGDVDNPTGGVRAVIPNKADYLDNKIFS
jgi:ATP adenylyltransferase